MSQNLPKVTVTKYKFNLTNPDKNVGHILKSSGSKIGYDLLYSSQQGLTSKGSKCGICDAKDANECLGHTLGIKLPMTVFNPLLMKNVLKLLRCFCITCSSIMITKDDLKKKKLLNYKESKRFDKISEELKNPGSGNCLQCHGINPKFSHTIGENVITLKYESGKPAEGKRTFDKLTAEQVLNIFDVISQENLILLGFNSRSDPKKWLLTENINLIAPCYRPATQRSEGEIIHDPFTINYHKILQNIAKWEEKKEGREKEEIEKDIYTSINSLMYSSEPGTMRKGVKGSLKERMTGKKAPTRRNMMGKRINSCMRGVLSPDPNIRVDQIGLPESWSKIMTRAPETVSEYNIHELQKDIYEGKILMINKINKRFNKYINISKLAPADKKLVIGDKVHKLLQNGDVVWFNRNPSLHKGSMMTYQVIFLPGDTIRLNPAATGPHGADFDGDEGNVYIPITPGAVIEASGKKMIGSCIISPQNNKPMIGLIQDFLSNGYLLTRRIQKTKTDGTVFYEHVMLTEDSFNDCVEAAEIDLDRLPEHKELCKFYGVPYLSGRSLFSLFLPKYFEYHRVTDTDPNEPVFEVKEGILVSGVVCKKVAGNVHNSLIQALVKFPSTEGARAALNFINRAQRGLSKWSEKAGGVSVGIIDCIAKKGKKNDEDESKMNKKIDEQARQIHLYERKKLDSKSPLEQKKLEAYINDSLCKITDIGMAYAKDVLSNENAFSIMEKTGARGSIGNTVSIVSLLGSMTVSGKRIQKDRFGRTLTSFPSNDPNPESQGLCRSSFSMGLDPSEHFLHMMSSREQLMAGISKTPEAGYIQKTLAMFLQGTHVSYDRTVRNIQREIVQFVYGNDDFDRSKLMQKNSETHFTDVSYHARVLNAEYIRNKRAKKREAKAK